MPENGDVIESVMAVWIGLQRDVHDRCRHWWVPQSVGLYEATLVALIEYACQLRKECFAVGMQQYVLKFKWWFPPTPSLGSAATRDASLARAEMHLFHGAPTVPPSTLDFINMWSELHQWLIWMCESLFVYHFFIGSFLSVHPWLPFFTNLWKFWPKKLNHLIFGRCLQLKV